MNSAGTGATRGNAIGRARDICTAGHVDLAATGPAS
jgi:hypothetical protein